MLTNETYIYYNMMKKLNKKIKNILQEIRTAFTGNEGKRTVKNIMEKPLHWNLISVSKTFLKQSCLILFKKKTKLDIYTWQNITSILLCFKNSEAKNVMNQDYFNAALINVLKGVLLRFAEYGALLSRSARLCFLTWKVIFKCLRFPSLFPLMGRS